jgi:hypothetical protein
MSDTEDEGGTRRCVSISILNGFSSSSRIFFTLKSGYTISSLEYGFPHALKCARLIEDYRGRERYLCHPILGIFNGALPRLLAALPYTV